MSDHDSHCPFLNRSDTRCATHFALDRIGSAFDDCFGEYQRCSIYRDILIERRSRHGVGEHAAPAGTTMSPAIVYTNLTVRSRSANVTVHAHHASAA